MGPPARYEPNRFAPILPALYSRYEDWFQASSLPASYRGTRENKEEEHDITWRDVGAARSGASAKQGGLECNGSRLVQ